MLLFMWPQLKAMTRAEALCGQWGGRGRPCGARNLGLGQRSHPRSSGKRFRAPRRSHPFKLRALQMPAWPEAPDGLWDTEIGDAPPAERHEGHRGGDPVPSGTSPPRG